MVNIEAFNEHNRIVAKDLMLGKADSVIMLHTTKDGNVVSSYSIDFSDNAGMYKTIGALEALKAKLLNHFVEGTIPDAEDDE